MTAIDTTPVNTRFTNSTIGFSSSGATSRPSLQFGQSVQPRPEPVRRTAAPVTMITPSDTRATSVMRW